MKQKAFTLTDHEANERRAHIEYDDEAFELEVITSMTEPYVIKLKERPEHFADRKVTGRML